MRSKHILREISSAQIVSQKQLVTSAAFLLLEYYYKLFLVGIYLLQQVWYSANLDANTNYKAAVFLKMKDYFLPLTLRWSTAFQLPQNTAK